MTLLAALKHKQILVLGAGITGLSCARYLSAQGLCFAVNDSRESPFSLDYNKDKFAAEHPTASLHLGQWHSELIRHADVILISPGIDSADAEIANYISADCHVMGDVELFCLLNNERDKSIGILAVTGSNGKSTVVTLLDHLGKCLGLNTQLGGNIGQPVLDIFTEELGCHNTGNIVDVPELLILELSSFQLETLTSMKAIATSVLNISDDHLDRHLTMANYQSIKQTIYSQSKWAVTNRDDPNTVTKNSSQLQCSFGSNIPEQQFGIRLIDEKAYLAFEEQVLIALDKLPLAGMHNALNYLAALALGYCAGWSITDMVDNLPSFSGLPHRCQRVENKDGIVWINDSKATNVGATIAAINGLAQTIAQHNNAGHKLILIAGGEGKGADFAPLLDPITQHVNQVITLGKDGNKIADVVKKSAVKTKAVHNLAQAVQVAKANAKVGDIVLLSPACASFDMFKGFADRGEQFASAVKKHGGVS